MLSPGTRLGPYEIVARIGAGGMGEVYKASDTRLGRLVAIKVSLAEFTDRFEREARAAASLNHPHICSIYDVGPNYLVMEYLEGSTLADHLKDGLLPASRIREFAMQIMDALEAAHSAGIIHRDLKPANIWITTRGDLKILDFGVAKVTAPPRAGEDSRPITATAEAELTKPGAVIGTLSYMSPEQALGRDVDARSDVFSAGAVLYEMAAGERPFRGEQHGDVPLAVVRERPASVSTVNPEIPDGLSAVIAQCLEKDAAARYQSAREAHQALQRLAPPEPQAFSRPGRRRIKLVLGAVLLLLSAASGVWLKFHFDHIRWAREQALPQIVEANRRAQYFTAFALARRAQQYIAGDPILESLWPQISRVVTVESVPSGAEVYRREYSAAKSPWEYLGRTPLIRMRVPQGYSRWKVSAPGYVTLELGGSVEETRMPPRPAETMRLVLAKQDGPAAGLVWVPEARTALQIPGLEGFPEVDLPDYFIDRR